MTEFESNIKINASQNTSKAIKTSKEVNEAIKEKIKEIFPGASQEVINDIITKRSSDLSSALSSRDKENILELVKSDASEAGKAASTNAEANKTKTKTKPVSQVKRLQSDDLTSVKKQKIGEGEEGKNQALLDSGQENSTDQKKSNWAEKVGGSKESDSYNKTEKQEAGNGTKTLQNKFRREDGSQQR